MKTLTIGKFGAVAMVALTFCVHAESPKTINVVGLEDDRDNAKVVAPAALGVKPRIDGGDVAAGAKKAVSVSADAIAEQATAAAAAAPQVNTANVKNLMLEGMVIPPSSEQAKTLEEAIRIILAQANKQVGTVSTNGIDRLTMPYQQLGDGKSYEVEWRRALRILLSPVGYNFTEDGELALFGLTAEVDAKHKELAQERLASNRTPILFTTNDSEGGMELRNAIRDIAVKAGVTVTTDYMDPADLYVPQQTVAAEGKMTAEDIGKARQKVIAQQAAVKRTKFDTNGQQIEWRTVLREILNPHGYDFIEVGGVVRIAKLAKLAEWEKEKIAAKPLVAKVIRLYHADPEQVVERLKGIKGLLVHPNASLQATRKKDDITSTVKNLNARIQTSSGQQSGMSDTTSQIFDKLVRPRTVPAIVAYDVEENIANVEAKVKLFDVKEKQVLIEAIIFQLNTDNDYNGNGDIDGVQWEGFEQFVPLYGAFGDAQSATKYADLLARDGFTVRDGHQMWMRTDGVDFKAMIQLIRKRNNSKLLSSPVIVVGDHSEAAIQVTRVDPVPDPENNFTDNDSTSRETVNLEWLMVRSGVLMWVAPEITDNGSSVRLTVHPQVVIPEEKVTFKYKTSTGQENEYFNYPLKMHEMDTRATVPTGATLLFGGLIDNKEVEVEDKVRWFGDLPAIGWLFRSKTTKMQQQNLMIMIRPTILEDTDTTGFETNTFKEVESVMVNSGRDLKKTTIGEPKSWKRTKQEFRDLYEERIVKPFEEDAESVGAEMEEAEVGSVDADGSSSSASAQ